MDPLTQQTAQSERELVKGILNAKSLDQHGQAVLFEGQEIANKTRVYYGLMKAAAKGNVNAANLLLKQAGMVALEDVDKDPEETARRKAAAQEKIERDLQTMKNLLTETMKAAGLYGPEQVFQIEVCATSLMTYRKMRSEYLDPDEKCFIIEQSREGAPRKKPNPLANELRQEAVCLMSNLRQLLKPLPEGVKKEEANSVLADLLEQMNREAEEE